MLSSPCAGVVTLQGSSQLYVAPEATMQVVSAAAAIFVESRAFCVGLSVQTSPTVITGTGTSTLEGQVQTSVCCNLCKVWLRCNLLCFTCRRLSCATMLRLTSPAACKSPAQ